MVIYFGINGKSSAAEEAGVTFSDTDSAPVPQFLNPGPAIFQI